MPYAGRHFVDSSPRRAVTGRTVPLIGAQRDVEGLIDSGLGIGVRQKRIGGGDFKSISLQKKKPGGFAREKFVRLVSHSRGKEHRPTGPNLFCAKRR